MIRLDAILFVHKKLSQKLCVCFIYMAIEDFVLYLLNNMSNKSILILCKLSNNKQPVHMFSTVCSFSCCSWLWANKWIDVSTVWLCIYTEGPHQGTLYVCVTGPQLAMKTSIVCAHAVNACKKTPEDVNFVLSQGTYRIWTHNETDTHTYSYIHTRLGWQSALAELRWTNGNLGKEECVWR